MKTIDAQVRSVVNGAAEFAQADPEPEENEVWTDVVLPA
jgi:pyruvate dehydrogenase E1 component alpha subunit